MNSERTIFSQLMDLVPRYEFDLCVKKYCSDVSPRKFSFWNQFLSMAFAQLTFRESLRDIEACLSSLGTKAYHMGFRNRISRSMLADANNQRDWRVWSDLAQVLIKQARHLYAEEELAVQFDQAMYALDSTTISLCLTLFPWARYKKKERAVKIHTQLDLRGNIPSFLLISQAKTADIKFLDELIIEAGAMYVMDRAYFDFARFFRFTSNGAYFVTRFKKNVPYRRTQIVSRSRYGAIRCDTSIRPLTREARKAYPLKLRLVEFYDEEKKRSFLFVTNNFSLSAQTIADIYKSRWHVELFFKWVKQHLRIKAFFGTSENAVKTQIWIAISVYLIVAIAKKQFSLDNKSLYSILQVLSISSTEKKPLFRAFFDVADDLACYAANNQLELFDMSTGH